MVSGECQDPPLCQEAHQGHGPRQVERQDGICPGTGPLGAVGQNGRVLVGGAALELAEVQRHAPK